MNSFLGPLLVVATIFAIGGEFYLQSKKMPPRETRPEPTLLEEWMQQVNKRQTTQPTPAPTPNPSQP